MRKGGKRAHPITFLPLRPRQGRFQGGKGAAYRPSDFRHIPPPPPATMQGKSGATKLLYLFRRQGKRRNEKLTISIAKALLYYFIFSVVSLKKQQKKKRIIIREMADVARQNRTRGGTNKASSRCSYNTTPALAPLKLFTSSSPTQIVGNVSRGGEIRKSAREGGLKRRALKKRDFLGRKSLPKRFILHQTFCSSTFVFLVYAQRGRDQTTKKRHNSTGR